MNNRLVFNSVGTPRRLAQAALLLFALLAGSAFALITGSWTINGSASASTVVNGITVTQSGQTSENNYANDTFNTANGTTGNPWWTNPYGDTVTVGASLLFRVMTTTSANTTYVVTFSKPVDNPVLHVDRVGGASGTTSNSSRWRLTAWNTQTGGVSMSRLSGNAQFELDTANSRFYRTPNQTISGTVDGECRTGDAASVARGTGCGSIQFNGTGITSLTFQVDSVGPGAGDELEFRWSFDGSRVVVRKQSVAGTGTFGFSASGALTQTFNLNTATTNPATSATYAVTNHASAINITETVPAGFSLLSASCVDQNNAAVASSLNTTTRQLTIAAAGYRANQTITCTFVNQRDPIIRLSKALPAGRVLPAHQFALSITGPGGPAQVTTTGAGTTANGVATINPATVGGNYQLSEAASGMANLDDYATAWNCTNALSGGQVPSGSGTSFALTPVAGDDLTCTFVNTAIPRADLSITKTNNAASVLSGQNTTYTIVATNNGPSDAHGAALRDPPPTGMTCHTVSCSSAAGAICPAVSVAALQSPGGVTVATFPSGGSVTLALTCTVD